MLYHFFGKDLIIDRNLEQKEQLHQEIKNLGFNFKYNPVFLNQIHSDKVLTISSVKKDYSISPLVKSDAIVTNVKNLPICIVTADCVPILLFDEVSKVVAICHAGWRGAFSQIIENTIAEMQNLGSGINNIKAIIGPAIRQESYEVSGDFFLNFIQKDQANKQFFLKSKKEGSGEEKYLFNLPKFCISKLNNNGIRNIKDKEINTYSNKDDFFRYRRAFHENKEDCGRNVSVIMIF